jgi:hypothetical protein
MTRLEFGITDLLDERFNIELEEYWKLNEKDKNYLTSVIVSSFIKKLYNEPHLIEFYLSMMDDRRLEAEYHNEYERAEIISRIQNKTKELFNKH